MCKTLAFRILHYPHHSRQLPTCLGRIEADMRTNDIRCTLSPPFSDVTANERSCGYVSLAFCTGSSSLGLFFSDTDDIACFPLSREWIPLPNTQSRISCIALTPHDVLTLVVLCSSSPSTSRISLQTLLPNSFVSRSLVNVRGVPLWLSRCSRTFVWIVAFLAPVY